MHHALKDILADAAFIDKRHGTESAPPMEAVPALSGLIGWPGHEPKDQGFRRLSKHRNKDLRLSPYPGYFPANMLMVSGLIFEMTAPFSPPDQDSLHLKPDTGQPPGSPHA